MDPKSRIILVTLLLFIYNTLFAYVIVTLTSNTSRFVFLMLLAFDYFIIFYLILQLVSELKFEKAMTRNLKGKRKR